jgi:predicted O-methyltransferase YrrM
MSFKLILAYFKHQLTANNRHGTHSPFVYKLADEVIYDFSTKKVYEGIEAQRKKLLNDDTYLQISDLGDNSIRQKVKLLTKNLEKPRIAQLIYRLAVHHQPHNVILLGIGLGITAAYLTKACPKALLIAMEECSGEANIANQVFKELDLTNVLLQVGNLESLLTKVVNEAKVLDLVYIDGRYTKETILNYFNCCLPKFNEHSLLIISCINQNEDMKVAWSKIKNHPQVTVTIDLFWLGLVYFRKGQAKEHFKLKF